MTHGYSVVRSCRYPQCTGGLLKVWYGLVKSDCSKNPYNGQPFLLFHSFCSPTQPLGGVLRTEKWRSKTELKIVPVSIMSCFICSSKLVTNHNGNRWVLFFSNIWYAMTSTNTLVHDLLHDLIMTRPSFWCMYAFRYFHHDSFVLLASVCTLVSLCIMLERYMVGQAW